MSPLTVWNAGLSAAVLALAAGLGWAALAVVRLRAGLAEARSELASISSRVKSLESPGTKPPEPTRRGTLRRADKGATEAPPPASTLISVPNIGASGGPDSAREQGEALSQRYRAIWELADNGAAPSVIAGATGMPVGRVEVILGLRRRERPEPQ